MKKLKKQILFLLTFIIVLIISNKVYAASATLSASSTNVTTGTTVNLTVGVQAAEIWNLKITSTGGTLGGQTTGIIDTPGVEVTKNVANATFTATTPGTYTITLSGTIASTDDVNNGRKQTVNKPITITVSNPTPKPSPTPTPAPTFQNVNQTVYATTEVNVRSSYSTSSSRIGSLQKGQSVTRTGIGSNGWSRVTYNGQTGYINSQYLTTTKPAEDLTTQPSTEPSAEPSTPPEETTNDAKLKSLSIVGVEITPEFNPDVTSYSANIGEEVTEVEVVVEVNSEKTKYEVVGNTELKDGENTVTITVTAENGTVTTYEVKLLKNVEPAPIEDNTNNTPVDTNKTETKINYKLILIIGAIVLITIIGITFAILYYRKQNDMEYAKPDYSFLREDEEKPKNTLEQIYDEKNNGQNDDDNNFRRGGRHF